jgi:alpha-beta hydrolase superfamily lysophospholipase
MVPFARALARTDGLAVLMLRYRLRGWNGSARDAARDAEEMLAELHRRRPGVPTALVGHSMGGRAVLHAAGAPDVRAVAALAPWLDGTDPVDQLAGRSCAGPPRVGSRFLCRGSADPAAPISPG